MASDSNSARSGGIGFSGLLAVLFIGLKLGHVINWSWWWVLSPLWIPVVIVLAVLAAAGVYVLATPRRRPTRRY